MALTLAQARTLLRRRLQEPTADQWTDADLTSLLNLGISDVQKLIQGPDPEAYITSADQNIVAGTSDYAFPTGAWWPQSVALYDTVALTYGDLGDPVPWGERVLAVAGDESKWSLFGRKVRISPTPSASVTSGLRIYYIQSLSESVDGNPLPVPDPLHGLVVLYAQEWARGETDEDESPIQKQIDRQIEMIPTWMRRMGGADRLTVDSTKEYD